MDASTYRKLLETSIDDLLANLGSDLQVGYFSPTSYRDAVRAGREWMTENTERIRASLCPRLETIDLDSRPPEVVAAIADLIASLKNIPSVATVSVLIYRYGVDSFCRGWSPSD
jgi:hypothetical protein